MESWSVILDNEWYLEGTYEQCCEAVNGINADPDFMGSCYMVPTSEITGR